MSATKKSMIIMLLIPAILLFLYILVCLYNEISGEADEVRLVDHFAQANQLQLNLSLVYLETNKGVLPGSETQLYAQGFIRNKLNPDNISYVAVLQYGNGYSKKDIFSDYQLLYGATINDIYEDGVILRDKITRKPILLIDGPNMGFSKEAYEGYNQISKYIFGAMLKNEEVNRDIRKKTHPRTKLHEAAEQGDLSQVQSLLAKGADVNAADTGLFTPLHGAVTYGHEDIVRVLIEHGADVIARDTGGYTPLHVAAVRGYVKVAELLIQHGAELGARNNNSNTPLEEAKNFGNKQVAEILRKHGEIGKLKKSQQAQPG